MPGVVHTWHRAKMMGLTDGDAVGTWKDVSGNGRDMTQGTAGNKPTFKASAMNGMPSVYFFADDFISFGDVFTGLASGEVFVVVKRDADPPANANTELGFWEFGVSGPGKAAHVPYADGTVYDNWGQIVRFTTVNPVQPMDVPCIYNVTSASGEWTNRLNGLELFTTAASFVGWTTAPTLGRSDPTDGYYIKGHFSELLTFNRRLAPPERLLVNRYLSREYRLGLPL